MSPAVDANSPPSSNVAWRDFAVACALFCVALVVLFGPALGGGRVFSFRDLGDYAIPQIKNELIAAGIPIRHTW